jgi:hypothetical protein
MFLNFPQSSKDVKRWWEPHLRHSEASPRCFVLCKVDPAVYCRLAWGRWKAPLPPIEDGDEGDGAIAVQIAIAPALALTPWRSLSALNERINVHTRQLSKIYVPPRGKTAGVKSGATPGRKTGTVDGQDSGAVARHSQTNRRSQLLASPP